MSVFAQERHAIEREPEWEQVRASRDAFEAILARLLKANGITDRLQHFALLGMVNHTATWVNPQGPPERERDRRRLLRHAAAVIRPATPEDGPALRAIDHEGWSYLHTPVPRPPLDKPFETSRACSSTSATARSPAT